MGFPKLRPLAFTVLNSKLLLEQGENEYINHPPGTKKQKNLVFPKFINGMDDFMEKINKSIISKNYDKTLQLIHQLKGQCSYMGGKYIHTHIYIYIIV